jgi:CDP-diacylglycerol--serine O-phosphatidyltransferase
MWLKNNIPNLITSMNLLCGCMAVMAVAKNETDVAGLFIFLAAGFDFLDGMAARLLNAKSEIGKQLDSLADMVSFGLAPGLIMFHMISQAAEIGFPQSSLATNLPYLALAIPVFSAWRLAKFNIDTRQEDRFIGLPTPACALFLSSFPIIKAYSIHFSSNFAMGILGFMFNPFILALLSIVMSLLLVANLPLFALKFKDYSWVRNKIRYIFITCVVILFATMQFTAVPLIIALYILISLVWREQ